MIELKYKNSKIIIVGEKLVKYMNDGYVFKIGENYINVYKNTEIKGE